MSAKLALIIANTDYADSKLAKLTAPSKDADAFASVLQAKDLAAFDDVVTVVNGAEPIARRAIAKFFSGRQLDDLLLLYFSGHGVRDDQGHLFLAMTDTDPCMLDATAVSSDFIARQMDNSRSKRQVLILDCCNSGAFASGIKAATGAGMGTGNAFEGNGFGRVVLTASDATQFAWEGNKVIGETTTNSLFTHFLVKGLEGEADTNGDGIITVDELYDYTYAEIVNRTPKQTPGKWTYKEQGQIILTSRVKPQTVKPLPLDPDLEENLLSTRNYIREAAVNELCSILHGPNLGRALSAELRLQYVAENDDSRAIARKAAQLLEEYHSSRAAAQAVPSETSVPGVVQSDQMISTEIASQSSSGEEGAAPVLAEAEKISSASLPAPHAKLSRSIAELRRYSAIAAIGLAIVGVIGLAWWTGARVPALPVSPSLAIPSPISTSNGSSTTLAAPVILSEPSSTPQPGVWSIEYFTGTELASPAARVSEPGQQNGQGGYAFQFSSAKLPQDPNIPRKNFSLRLVGTFHFARAIYEFHCEHQDGCRISVDGITGIDAWQDGGDSDDLARYVTEGNHRVDVEFYDRSGQGSLKVVWGIRPPDTPTLTATPTATRTSTPLPATKRPKKPNPPPCNAC